MEIGIPNPVSQDIFTIAPELIQLFPPQLMKQHRFVPVKIEKQKLFLAMVNVHDHIAQENARAISGKEIQIVPVTEIAFLRTYQKYFFTTSATSFSKELALDESAITTGQISKGIEPQVVRVVNRLVEIAIDQQASDIHLEPQRKGLFARIRVDGVLNTIHQFPSSVQSLLVSRIKIMAAMDISERRLPQDGQFTFSKGTENVGVRVSIVPVHYGEKVVLRVMTRSVLQMDLRALKLPDHLKTLYVSIIERPHGLILVTGPTGTGKTTTLYATLKHLLSNYKNIVTLEDPIEYELLAHTTNDLGLTQIQMNPKIGMTFAAGLRSALRQDPDVIMVGEIRDKETAEITMRAVMTGHLVLSTLHTSDAPSALNRLVEMGIERYLITSSVSVVLAQQLVRILCVKCKRRVNPTDESIKKMFPHGDIPPEANIFHATGCTECLESGYRGRMPIFELLAVDNEIRHQMRMNSSVEQLRKVSRAKGNKSLRDFGIELICNGLTTYDEVIRTTVDEHSSFAL